VPCDFTVKFQYAPCLSFDKSTTGTGNTPKFTLTYKFDADRLVYATYSKGFRPGGINRVGDLPPYKADYLENYEIGWKTSWLDHHLRYNGAFFWEDWTNFQFAFLGANGLTRIANAGAARVTGWENELQWAVAHGLSFMAGLTLLDPKLTKNYCGELDSNGNPVTSNPCPPKVGSPPGTPSFAPLAPEGTQLPGTSKIKGNLLVRDDFPLGGMEAYWQGAFVYQSQQWADMRLAQRGEIGPQPAFGTIDLAFGVSRDAYALDLFIVNLLDERGQTFRFNQCASCSIVANYAVPTQPRTISLRWAQKF
jgi:outer membrane receptor protein involved in Fe transport